MPSAVHDLTPKQKRDVPISFRVTSELDHLIDAIAKERGVTRVEVITFVVTDYARRKGIKPDPTPTPTTPEK